MDTQLSGMTTVCGEYQRLLEESQRALEIWNEVRAQVCQSRLTGKAAGDELLRLQAKYARAYAVEQRHVHNCFLCQLVCGANGRESENRSDSLAETLYA
jgi:hypothetical protein